MSQTIILGLKIKNFVHFLFTFNILNVQQLFVLHTTPQRTKSECIILFVLMSISSTPKEISRPILIILLYQLYFLHCFQYNILNVVIFTNTLHIISCRICFSIQLFVVSFNLAQI